MAEANGFVVNLFGKIFELFDRVYTEYGAWSLIIGAFIVYTIYRLILAPVVGGVVSAGQSDMVRKIRSDRSPKGVAGLEKR